MLCGRGAPARRASWMAMTASARRAGHVTPTAALQGRRQCQRMRHRWSLSCCRAPDEGAEGERGRAQLVERRHERRARRHGGERERWRGAARGGARAQRHCAGAESAQAARAERADGDAAARARCAHMKRPGGEQLDGSALTWRSRLTQRSADVAARLATASRAPVPARPRARTRMATTLSARAAPRCTARPARASRCVASAHGGPSAPAGACLPQPGTALRSAPCF